MANISYIHLLSQIESFSSAHLQVQKFGSDFPGQMPNFATEGEGYPILFVSPTNSIFDENTTTFDIDVYVWDIIQKDRQNINNILSDTNQIVSDLSKWFKDGDIYGIDLISSSTAEPLNNGLLDYTAGWKMKMQLEVNTYSVCEIPFNEAPVVVTEVCDIVYSQYLSCETLEDCPVIQTIEGDITNINTILDGITGSTPSELVFFSSNNPNDVGTVFDPNTPQNDDVLYISSGDSSNWTWDSGTSNYITYTASTVNSTPWELYLTNIDAGGNKTAFIERNGPIFINSVASNAGRYAGYFYSRTTSGVGRGLIVKKDLRTTAGDYLTVLGQNFSTGEVQNKLRVDHDGFTEINDVYKLPNVDGNANDVMYTDGSGNVSWTGITSLIPPVVPTTTYWTSGSTGNFSIKTINSSSTNATADYAVAQGVDTLASGYASHAEGRDTFATGFGSHAQNNDTYANGVFSHAEGSSSVANGTASHAEGDSTLAAGDYSHSEGHRTEASGDSSHAEGLDTIASGSVSHAEGYFTRATGVNSHAEGFNTRATGDYSHASGQNTDASGQYSHTQGLETIAGGTYSSAGGYRSVASGETSFVYGNDSAALGDSTFVFGDNITGTTDNTVYVPKLNIGILPTGTTVYGLGIDINGYVIQSTLASPDTFVTGATYSNNTFTYTNNIGGTFNVLFNTLTGLTVNGDTGLNGQISGLTFTGTTDRMVEASSGGTLSAVRDIIEGYISDATNQTKLSTLNNWTINGSYTGSTITDTFQGQNHYDDNYWFTAVADNMWIRIIRG